VPLVVTNDAPSGNATVQYSDALSPTVTITSVDPDSNGAALAAAAVGLPAGMSLAAGPMSADGDLPGTAIWTVAGTTTAAPGTYPVTVTATDELGGTGTTSFSITVTQENADATYTGDELIFTAPGGSSASVLLRATVRDSSRYDPTDSAPGDIRTASVTFKEDSTILCGPAAVVLLGSDPTLGTFSCTRSLSVGAHTIGIYVNGYYVGGAEGIVEVATPDGSFITGGGFRLASTSAGTYAVPPGGREQFAFNVKYTKTVSDTPPDLTTLSSLLSILPQTAAGVQNFLDHPLADHLIDGGLRQRAGDDLAGPVALDEVGDGAGVGPHVDVELAQAFKNIGLPGARVRDLGVGLHVANRVEGAHDVAVPAEPLEALQAFGNRRGGVGRRGLHPAHRVARRLLAMLAMTVRRMVTWNPSSRCADSGLRYSGRSRTSSSPSVRKVTAWLACMPWEMSRSTRRRLSLVS